MANYKHHIISNYLPIYIGYGISNKTNQRKQNIYWTILLLQDITKLLSKKNTYYIIV